MREIREILGLRPGLRKIRVRFGLIPKDNMEIAIITRSLMQIMIDLATQVDVPSEDVIMGRTMPASRVSALGGDALKRNIRISQGDERPGSSFTAVKYRENWFWISNEDYASKQTFAYLMLLFSLTESADKAGLPIVTIPAN
jgi:hypothetical protein